MFIATTLLLQLAAALTSNFMKICKIIKKMLLRYGDGHILLN